MKNGARPDALFMAVAFAAALLVFMAGVLKPRYNFDMVGYVAAAHYKDGARGVALSERTYSEVRQEVGPEQFLALTSGNYRATVHAFPESLTQQLPFYSIRVAYVEAMRVLKKAGVSYPKASYLLSAAFASLAVLVLARIHARLGLPIVLFPVLVFFSGLIDIAQRSTPDALVCLASLSLILLLLEKSRLLFILAALMPLFRTDFILLSLFVLVLAFFHISKAEACLSLLAALALYYGINRSAGNYGFLTIFNFTFISRNPFPAQMPISTDPLDYVNAYLAGGRSFVMSKAFLLYAGAALLLALKAAKGRLRYADQALVVPALLFVMSHMMLFPANFQRFFVFAVCITALWFCKGVWEEIPGFRAARDKALVEPHSTPSSGR